MSGCARLSTSTWRRPFGVRAEKTPFPGKLLYQVTRYFARRDSVSSDTFSVVGWDIGGVNIKAGRLLCQSGIIGRKVTIRPFEIWREPEKLAKLLQETGNELGTKGAKALAVTMTAELSDVFRNRKEGVLSVIDAVDKAFPDIPAYLLSLSGDLVPLKKSRKRPLNFAATNWLASALFVATIHPDCILVDVGSTTTDIIPIRHGRVNVKGLTDMDRLSSGELVYTGALRTNPNTVASLVPINGQICRVSAEYFAVMADVYFILGRLSSEKYICSTPDGREKSLPAARERLARLICSDRDVMRDEEISKLAAYLFEKQLQQVAEGLLQVLSRLKDGYRLPLVVAGSGSYLCEEIGRRLGLTILDLGKEWSEKTLSALPSLSVAHLLAEQLDGQR